MKALLKNYRQAPRKVRLLADLVRGKDARKALITLSFTDKRAAAPIAKLIKSAIANAAGKGISAEHLFISDIRVDKGVTMKRSMPKAFGRAAPINKRTSNLVVALSERVAKEGDIKKETKRKSKIKNPNSKI